MSFGGCKPGDPCWDLGYVFNDVLPPNIISGLNELYGCGINPYSFIDCNILTGCTSVLSGLTGPYITGATYNSSTGCLTFYRQSGATFSACGFLTGTTDTSSGYWSAGTKGIYYTGGTNTYVGIGTQNPTKTLTVRGSVSSSSTLDVEGNTTLSSTLNVSGTTTLGADLNILQSNRIYFGSDQDTQTSIRETSNNLRIEADDDILMYPDDDFKIGVGSSQYAVFDGGSTSLIVGASAVPSARLSLVNAVQNVSFGELGAECTNHPVFMDMQSLQDTEQQKLVFSETTVAEEGVIHTFQIFGTPLEPGSESTIASDLVLGGYAAGESCASEVLRISNNTRVGILNKAPAYTLDVTGSMNASGTIYSAGTDLLSLFCGKPCGGGGATGEWSAATQGITYTGGSSTYVGIATTNPNKPLSVLGGISGTSTLNINGNSYLDGTLSIGLSGATPSANIEVKDYIYFNETYLSTFIGFESGKYWSANTNTRWNTAVGHGTMGTFNTYGNLDGALRNTALGCYAMAYLADGDSNTGIGQSAMQSIISGSYNTALGNDALINLSYNHYNTAIGYKAIEYNNRDDGSETHNTALGNQSMNIMGFGTGNTAVGSLAMPGSLFGGFGGSGCTAIGMYALKNTGTASPGAKYNIGLGLSAGANITNGDYNICIGAHTDAASATGDYQMNIGNVLYGNDEYSDGAISQIGIGYNDPKVKLDVHHNPTDLASETGGGDVVTFGTESDDSLTAGKLMWLHTDGFWYHTDADNVASGATSLLAIALGTAVSDGMLLRGYYNLTDYIAGAFAKGTACYVSEVAATVDFTAPSATADYVRILGYGTDTANVIYFNPDKTWVELS